MSSQEPGVAPDDTGAMPHGQGAPWGRYAAVMAGLSAASVFVINRWADIRPVVESPAIIVISMLAVFGLGGLSTYWLLARPHEQRLFSAERVINRLREQERTYLQREGDMKAHIASLEASVSFLKEELAEVKRQLESLPRTARRPRSPKGD